LALDTQERIDDDEEEARTLRASYLSARAYIAKEY
jgi:hypothetical protein